MKGSISILMVVGIVPLVLFLTIGSLSLTRFYYLLEQQQKVIDTAALIAGSAYPNMELAKSKAELYLQLRTKFNMQDLEIRFEDRVAIINTSSAYKMELIDYFGINIQIPVDLTGRSKTRAQNIALLIDTSSYLAPNPQAEDLWDSNQYPAANFIKDNFSSLNLAKYSVSPAALTQVCFNPMLEAIKRVAIEITAYAKVSAENNFALASFPGYENHFDEIYYQGAANKALASSYTYKFNAASICAAVAEREYSNPAYRFPLSSAIFGVDYYINQDDLSFKQEKLPIFSAEEQIWSLSAKVPAYQYSIDHLLRFMVSALSGATDKYSSNKAIVIAGDLPRFFDSRYPQSEARTATLEAFQLLAQLGEISQSKVRLYYLIFENKYNKLFTAEEVQQFQADINGIFEDSKQISVQVKTIDLHNDYSAEVYEILLEDQNAILLS